MYLRSLSAEFWLRTMAKTLRLERKAAVTADTPMLPVDPMTRTVSMIGWLVVELRIWRDVEK